MTDFDALLPDNSAQPVSPPLPDTVKTDPESAPTDSVPQAPPEKFSTLVDAVTSDRVSQAQASTAAMQGTSADKAAQALELGKQFGLPAAAILPNIDSYAAQADMRKNYKILADNPSLAAWVNDQPAAANVAKDDFDKLNVISKIAVTLAKMNEPVIQNQLADAQANLMTENMAGLDTTETQARIQSLKTGLEGYALYQPTGVYGKVSTGLNQAMGLVDNILDALPGAAAGAAVGAAVGAPEGGVGAIPGAVVGAGVGLKVSLAGVWAKQAAGQTYSTLSDVRDKDGQGMSESAKQIASGTVAALTFGIGMVGAPAQGAVAKDALTSLSGDALKEAVQRPTVMAALTTIAKDTAIGAGQGAAMMGSMALAQQLGVEMGKKISPGDWETVANSPKLRAEYIDQLADAIEGGAITFGALHGVGGAISEYGNYKQSEAMRQQFASLMDKSQESKTRERSPDAFQTFMQSQLKNTGAENVYVPAAKVQSLYTKSGIRPGAEDGIFGKAVPDIADQLQQAGTVNGDVVIPAADYAAHIAGTPLDKALRNDLRVTQEGMSINEANEFSQKYQDIISKLGDAVTAQQKEGEPTAKIYEDMKARVQAAGFTDAQASQYASVTAARYSTRGERLGVDPLELYHQQGIEIRRGVEGESPTAALEAFPAKQVPNAPTLDDLEKNSRDQIKGENRPITELLDYLKGEKKLPRDKQKLSLTAFLKKAGGLQDESGELATMDANKQVKGLVRKKGGMSLDDAGLKAHEAGYITSENGERPRVNEFIDAIRHDLLKRDVFSNNDTMFEKGKRSQAFDLEGMLEQHQIAYEGRDNADILKDLQDAGLIAGHPVEEFNQGAAMESVHAAVMHADGLVDKPVNAGEGREVSSDIKRGDDVVQYQKKGATKEELFALAEKHKTGYEKWVKQITTDIDGAAPYSEGEGGPTGVRVKKQAGRIDEKIEEKGGDAGAISDYLGGAIEVANPKALAEVLNRIAESGAKVIEVEDMLTSDDKTKNDGYRAMHMQLQLEPGFSAELQILPKSVAKIKETMHRDYVKFRGDDAEERAEKDPVFAEKMEAARTKLIDNYQAAFDKFIGTSDKLKTPEFEKWFGNSKVTDHQGNPRVVYHGTQSDIEKFEPGVRKSAPVYGQGTYFAADPYLANQFALRRGEGGGNVVPVYLKLENPYISDANDFRRKFSGVDKEEITQLLKNEGHDGIIINRGKNIKDTEYVAFDANQIKSIHNTGAFASNDARILNQDARAKVTIAEGQHIITLFQGADKSTILHEMAHIWLNELQADAAREDAPTQVKKDWETIRTYIGHDQGAIQEASHETFARSYEQYFMEGKAPSQSLRGAFQRVRQWMTAIYRTVKNLNVPMNDDVRQVFDRMLATDDEITQMEKRQSANQLFRTKEQAGMTDAEFKAYNDKALNAQQAARDELLTQALEEVRKKNSREWNAAAADIKPDVAAAIKGRQDIRALNWFKTGKILDAEGNEIDVPKMSIDKNALEAISPGAGKEMPRAVKVEEGGAHPDEIAPLLGYDTGADMINDLRELGKTEKNAGRQQVENYLTDQEVNAKLREHFGVSDEQLRQRAEELMGSPDRIELKLAELRALARKTGATATFTKENIGQWADSHIADMNALGVSNAYQFVRASAKAGRDAIRALEKGDDKGAMEALQRQALNMALADRAKDFAADYASGNKLFKYASSKPTIKSTDQGYLNHVHALLSDFGFKVRRDATELKNSLAGQTLKDFVIDKVGIGREVFTPDYLMEKDLPGYKDLTTAQFNDLHNMVQSLLHNGRDEQSILVDGKRIEKDRIITEILNNLDSFESKPKSEYLNPADAGFLRRNLDKFTSILRAADAELLKPEQFFDWLDKRNVLGPINKYVFRPMKDAQVMENDLLAEQSKAFRDLNVPDEWHKSLGDDVFNDQLIDPDTGTPTKMSRKTMLTIALNTGNESNLKKLTEGYQWNAGDVQEFLQKNMTKADWDFVQHSWDSFEKLWPKIEAMQRRMNGVAPPKIEATPIKTPHGDYRGGYYPVVYDPTKTTVGERAQSAESIFDHDYYRPATAQGHTIARVQNFTDKIMLNMDVMPWKLKQAIHDLSFREAIVNADKILSDVRFKNALKDKWGPEYGKEFRPWLRDVANQPNADNRPMSFIDNALRYSRMTMVEMGIGFRLTTMFKHGLTALSNSVGELGPDAMRRGVQEYYSDRAGKREFVMERSGEMRHRMTQYDRDIRENMANLLGEKSVLQTMRHFGHYGVAFLDMESAMPTWIGAYRKAMAEGLEEKDAVYSADKTVRNAHGAQGQVDIAGVQRGPEYKKLFTMFYGFFNHMYNRERDIVRRTQESPTGLDMAKILGKTLAYIAIPALVEQAISGTNDKDEGWGKWASKAIANQMAATVPLVRDVSGYLEHGRAQETPMSRTIRALGAQAKDIGNVATGNPASAKWLKHAIETPGYITGAPTGQIATGAQYLWDVSDGKEDPKDVKEWVHGVMYGTSRPK